MAIECLSEALGSPYSDFNTKGLYTYLYKNNSPTGFKTRLNGTL
jgi:hypothetical protein